MAGVHWTKEQLQAFRTQARVLNCRPGADATRKEPRMNKTETEFFLMLKHDYSSEYRILLHESITLKVGAVRCRYTPDFCVVHKSGTITFIECKGAFVRDDARVKFQSAVLQYPEFTWIYAQKKQGTWTKTVYKNGIKVI